MIRFWIEAEPIHYSKYSSGWSFKEWFCFELKDEKGSVVRETIGLVDNGIKTRHPEEYSKFLAMVEPYRAEINEAAKAEYLAKHGVREV